MKKLLGISLAMLLTVMAVAAYAAPSKTTGDMVQTDTVNMPAVVASVPTTDAAVEMAAKVTTDMGEKIAAGITAAAYFGENVQADIAAALPADKDAATLVCNELVPLAISGYAEGMGDVMAKIQFATVYEKGQPVVALLGFVNGENVEWNVLKAQAIEGGLVELTIPADLALKMTTQNALLAVLN